MYRTEPEGGSGEQKATDALNKDEGGQVPTEGDKEEWSNLYEDDFALQEPEEQNVEV